MRIQSIFHPACDTMAWRVHASNCHISIRSLQWEVTVHILRACGLRSAIYAHWFWLFLTLSLYLSLKVLCFVFVWASCQHRWSETADWTQVLLTGEWMKTASAKVTVGKCSICRHQYCVISSKTRSFIPFSQRAITATLSTSFVSFVMALTLVIPLKHLQSCLSHISIGLSISHRAFAKCYGSVYKILLYLCDDEVSVSPSHTEQTLCRIVLWTPFISH